MEDKLYTIYEVADKLHMHHKTIRKFINDGKLVATKVGKQWRISEQDLLSFMEHKEVVATEHMEFSTKDIQKKISNSTTHISTVIDIEEIDKNQYMRISNTLIAIMNSNDRKMSHATLSVKYSENECRLKILLWGQMDFMQEMLDVIKILTDKDAVS